MNNHRTLSAPTIGEMTLTAVFTALICVTAPISIPVGAIPITLATLSVMLSGVLLGRKKGTAATALYLLIGCLGLPVFAGFSSGASCLFGVTGGYMFGYLPCAWLSGFFAEIAAGRNKAERAAILFAGMLSGTLACYSLGTLWFCLLTGTEPGYALTVCVLPFLFGDLLKMLSVYILSGRLRHTRPEK